MNNISTLTTPRESLHLLSQITVKCLDLPSASNCRIAAVAFISFVATAAGHRAVTLECYPQSAAESRAALQPSSLPALEGWFRVATLGAARPSTPAADTYGGALSWAKLVVRLCLCCPDVLGLH